MRDLEAATLYAQTLGFTVLTVKHIRIKTSRPSAWRRGILVIELLRPLSEICRSPSFAATQARNFTTRRTGLTTCAQSLLSSKARGVRSIDEEPRKGAHGNLIAFLHPKSTDGVLVELCSAPKRWEPAPLPLPVLKLPLVAGSVIRMAAI